MKILTVGATGKFAGLVVPELKKRGVTVRALVRDQSKESAAREQGADEIAIGNLEDPKSLRSAAEGVDGVFHLNPAFVPHEADMGVTMVEAAKAAGVRKFVFSGVIHPSLSKMVNHAAKLPVEEALYESGMVFTVLQPAMFMQNLVSAWKAGDGTQSFFAALFGASKGLLCGLSRCRGSGSLGSDRRQTGLRHF
jgi:uncharacterized protein YbjT (DUF2867 family)